jgi:lipoprotein-releasing system permease protein
MNIEIFPQDVYFLEKMPSEINPASILVIFLLSLITTIIASLIPAVAITKMNTIQALKYE